MDTVFIAAGWWSYEGYSPPVAVFSTREAAEAFAKESSDYYDGVEVFELPVRIETAPE